MAEYYINNKLYTSEQEVKRDFPNVFINFNNLPDGGVTVLPAPKPTPTTNLKVVVRNGVELDGLGNTVQAWIERDMFTADILDADGVTVLKTVAEQETEYLAKLDADALTKASELKLKEIESDFIKAEELPVTYNGSNYAGGDESATSIDKYVRLNRLAGNTTHTIWDADKIDHVLTDAEVDGLILTVGASASANKFAMKNRKLAVFNATTVAEVEAI